MIKSIGHACYIVSDIEKSIDFYCHVLGLNHAFDFTNAQGTRVGAYIHVGRRNFIELFQGKPETCGHQTSYKHLCLEVDSLEKTTAALKSKGLTVERVSLGKDNSYQGWTKDPDGNPIEFHQYTPDSLQTQALQRLGISD